MNTLLKRGLSAYIIFIKNKLAVSLMMLVSGAIMAIAALNGQGNDTKTLPILITAAGVVFSFWSFYKIGYIKANYDKAEDKAQKSVEWRLIALQIIESVAYIVVTVAGIYLLLNESLVDVILNLMVGIFTTFNGIMGVINLLKRLSNRDWRWVVRLILTMFELAVGPYFIIASSAIDIKSLVMMGILTAVAGLIEVIAAFSTQALKDTFKDGKDIVRTLKTGKAKEEEE
ncbi:DUF308 domain-containing protein [Candidatus Saccharibacteria bacterium]|nr:DUF308 domain-containing protein [Candidatus Saccharibacteria bacterium]